MALPLPASSAADRRYVALDGLRGLAVLLVFCVHAAGNAAGVTLGLDFERAQFGALANVGERALFWLYRSHHGVFLFFVLSGFLIGRMWWPEPALRYATFAWRRMLRVYPAFLAAFAASLLFAWSSGTWPPPDAVRLVGNFLFLNGAPGTSVAAFNVVTWSLFYEMTFYLVFPLLAWWPRRRGSSGVWLWGTGVALPAVATALGADPLVLCWSLLFVGVALAVHEDALRDLAGKVPSAAILIVYFAVTSAALVDALSPAIAILAFGGAALMVVAKALRNDNVIAGALGWPPLRRLGNISYSFYLVHWMIVVLVARAVLPHANALGVAGATAVIFVAGFTASAVAAAALWWCAERPYFAWAHGRRHPTASEEPPRR